MSILINKSTRVVVQGITGREARFHSMDMMNYGTQIVAGVTPGKGGSWVLNEKVPVFDSMQMAVEATEANTSIVFVPAHQATDALYEAADSGVELVICVTDGIPVQDIVKVNAYMKTKGVRLLGPNCPGIITPGEQKVGIYPTDCVMSGRIGVVSRSSTISYMTMDRMKTVGLGVSSCVGIGGDLICGTTFVDVLEMFEVDPYTDKILLMGEIGGLEEERAAKYVAYQMSKPVIAYVAGMNIPEGKRTTHPGAFIEGGIGSAREKLEAFRNAGIKATSNWMELMDLLK
ncbi:MAG: succinate--CoA ligase subunit alpha [Anaerolineaceae bacterium]|nr:succinate--CoA ligase subunit alpha [Anaerolineaceae bacterium]